MGDQLLIRDVPERIRSWIESERRQRMMTQKEFVIHALEKACDGGRQPSLFDEIAARPQPISDSTPFTFADLFAGIGGLRIGLQRAGGRCVFSSEWDKNAQKTPVRRHHDVLAGGFPCQPFSIA